MAHVGKVDNNEIEAPPQSVTYDASDFSVDEGERMLRTMYRHRAGEIIRGGWKIIKQVHTCRSPSIDKMIGGKADSGLQHVASIEGSVE